jgi:hypothetical protein
MRYAGQAIAYALFAAFVAVLSVWPGYTMLPADEAILSLSFSHAGERVGECRQLTQQELNELPPNMRKPAECPRERNPVMVRLASGGTLLYTDTLQPSGLWKDGKANVYQRITVDVGRHRIEVGMNDAGGGPSFTHEAVFDIDVLPGQNRVVTFDGLSDRFVLDQMMDGKQP